MDLADVARISRVLRTASRLTGKPAPALANTFNDASILLVLEEEFAQSANATESLLCSINILRRFCPQVTVCVPDAAQPMAEQAISASQALAGHGSARVTTRPPELVGFTAVLNIGTAILPHSCSC